MMNDDDEHILNYKRSLSKYISFDIVVKYVMLKFLLHKYYSIYIICYNI